MKPTVLIFGGTGYIGSVLSQVLDDHHYSVIIVTRKQWLHKKRIECRDIEYRYFDIHSEELAQDLIPDTPCYIVNLAGESIAKARWTRKKKEQIIKSRTQMGKAIFKMIRQHKEQIRCIVSASAIGWYGENSDGRAFVESASPATDFLGETCRRWEESITAVTDLGIRLVIFRIGLVLGYKGGLLRPIKRCLEWGVAPIFGNGQQILSWIHITDFVAMIVHALQKESLNGVYNAVAPIPISQKYLMHTLQKVYYSTTRKIYFPKWLIKLIVGKEKSAEILKSCRVSSRKIESTQFEFRFGNIEKSLRNLLLEV